MIAVTIDQSGSLNINRAGRYKPQQCPRKNPQCQCGDWCPLFGEVEPHQTAEGWSAYLLSLCETTLVIDAQKFIDQRPRR